MQSAPSVQDIEPCANETADRIATAIVTVVPFLALGVVGWQAWQSLLHWHDFVVFGVVYVLTGLGITVGFHRLLAHRAFKTSRAFQFFLSLLGVLAGQNGPLWWVAHHRHHHQHSDTERDTHSPRRGFFWSHMGWLFSPASVSLRRDLVRDLERLPEMRLLERHYYADLLVYAAGLYLLGEGWRRLDPGAGVSGLQLVVWAASSARSGSTT